MTRKIKGRRKKPEKHKLGYFLFNILFGTIIFMIGYYAYIVNFEHNLEQLLYILIWNIISGLFASLICRTLMNYWEFDPNLNFYIRSMMMTSVFSIMVFLGLYSTLFERYQIQATTLIDFWELIISRDFWEFTLIILIIKLFVFFGSDYFADKIAFGG